VYWLLWIEVYSVLPYHPEQRISGICKRLSPINWQ